MQVVRLLASAAALCGLGATAAPTSNLTYEYIVVGSGAGGGPLASRLARAGHSTLLIESGDDQGANANYSVPGYQAIVTQDPKLRWDIYVNHYQDQARAQLDPKYVWETPSGGIYVGPGAPAGSTGKGILYPRAGTLGGCVSHNALIWITPDASGWDNIANITGDQSWSASNMAQYLDRVYEWLVTGPTDPTILVRDTQLVRQLAGGATVMGVGGFNGIKTGTGFLEALTEDPNAQVPGRDSNQGFFQIPLIQKGGARDGVRDFIVDTANAGYPLTVRTNCFVTKIDFDTSSGTPQATGVEFLDGEHLYHASPLSGGSGTPGKATATKEVIISGGTYNTVQMLTLSGIGPEAELNKFSIPVVKNLPGLGTNMQDRYEIPVNSIHEDDFSILDGCTFDMKPHDLCYKQWADNVEVLAARGAYATDGLAAAMVARSAYASDTDVDLFIFGGPVDFTGYFPGWGDAAVADHKHWSWYTLKAHTRNTAGTVQLASADPLEQPLINFNYFDTGTTAGGADELDLNALIQAVQMSRAALSHYNDMGVSLLPGSPFVEQEPGPNVTSTEDIGNYIKERAWGHHACCTAAIGATDDPMAVIDSEFRVIGVSGLRVVDASVFPRIPGIFIQAPIFMVSEKAADVILNGNSTGNSTLL